MYKCVIWSNNSYGREYEVTTKSAMQCAMAYGRADYGEVVEIRTQGGKVVSRVRWDVMTHSYVRVAI